MSDADVAFCLTHDMFHALELRDIDCDFEDWLWATNRDRRQRWAGKANMSDIDLDRLDALADNATPGPWAAPRQFSENGDWIDIVDSEGKPIDFFAFDEVKRIAVPSPDAKFIAATDPDTVRALIARVREAEVRLDQVRAFAQEQHDEIIGRYNLTGAADSHRAGFAAACSDILAILDQAKEETTVSEHVFYGVACNSADEVALAAEIPLSETERGVLSAAVIAEAVTGSDWLIKHDRQVKAEALREAADELTPGDDKVDDWGIEAGLLRARADRIEKGDE